MEQRDKNTEVYEPPTMTEAGKFTKVTLGPPWGHRRDWHGHSRRHH